MCKRRSRSGQQKRHTLVFFFLKKGNHNLILSLFFIHFDFSTLKTTLWFFSLLTCCTQHLFTFASLNSKQKERKKQALEFSRTTSLFFNLLKLFIPLLFLHMDYGQAMGLKIWNYIFVLFGLNRKSLLFSTFHVFFIFLLMSLTWDSVFGMGGIPNRSFHRFWALGNDYWC